MLSLLQLHRCSHSLKLGSSRLLVSNTALQSRIIPRQIITTTRNGRNDAFKISDIILKRNNFVARLCSTSQKPKTSKVVGYWLLGCSGMVFTAVVLGGVTRITESGLSMVTWKLLGEKLPRTEEEWEKEFENYKQYPEYKYKNMNMTLSEFKWIWWMEYAHRSWGRAIGAAVFLPAAAFWATGHLGRAMKIRVGACCVLVAAQGLMGWYMVKSGLQDRFQGPSDVPRVSQYRLAAHLGLAFVLYVLLLGGALRMLRPPPRAPLLPTAPPTAPPLRPLVTCARVFKGMVFVTALSGAFVAGLDAGLVYSSFPKMGDRWLPDDIMSMTPPQRNLTENPTTVQFDHRVLGTTTVCLASALWLMARRRPLPPGARRAADAVGAMAWLQVTLGVSTLLLHVPATLAASHQAGSLALLSLAVWLTHELRLLRYLPK